MTTKRVSDKPIKQSLRALLDEEEISQRELTRRCKRHGWGSYGSISLILSEELRASETAMEAIATALQISPEHFAEYRLEKARNSLDPEKVGFATALRNLESWERLAGWN